MRTTPVLRLLALCFTMFATALSQQAQNNDYVDLPEASARQQRVPNVCYACRCGLSGRSVRLVGGQQVASEEYPWLAAVLVGNNGTGGGALISNRYVLTSASNVVGVPASQITVSLGSSALCSVNAPLVNVSVDSVRAYPGYSTDGVGPNLALLRLSTPVVFGTDIRPICLPPSDRSSYWGQVAYIVSWGGNATSSNSTDNTTSLYSCRPRQLLEPVLRPDLCGTAGGRGRGCVGSPGAPSLVCQTDSGGLVQIRSRRAGEFQLIGILTGTPCNSTGPASFTRTAAYLRWILNGISDSCVCHAPGVI